MNSNLRSPISIRFRWYFLPAIGVFAALWLGGVARAEEGILVQGSGVAKARPTQVEIDGVISAEAELAADATVKFRDAKKRTLAAFAALKIPDLSIVSGGLSVESVADANTQMMVMRGMPVPATNQKVRIVEVSQITLANTQQLAPEVLLDNVLKILDVARDVGFRVGPAPPTNNQEMVMRMQQGQENGGGIVSFKLPDSTAVRDKAYAAALDDARAKAQRLAGLAGVKLGRVLSVQENFAADEEMTKYLYSLGFSGKGAEKDAAISGTSTGDLVLRVNLVVRFEIGK